MLFKVHCTEVRIMWRAYPVDLYSSLGWLLAPAVFYLPRAWMWTVQKCKVFRIEWQTLLRDTLPTANRYVFQYREIKFKVGHDLPYLASGRQIKTPRKPFR